MHYEPCKLTEAKQKTRKNSDIRKLLMKIIERGEACVEIKEFPHKDHHSCANALRNRIKQDRFKQLEVLVSNKRVFVINTLLVKEED
jgi:hypothetical protein